MTTAGSFRPNSTSNTPYLHDAWVARFRGKGKEERTDEKILGRNIIGFMQRKQWIHWIQRMNWGLKTIIGNWHQPRYDDF